MPTKESEADFWTKSDWKASLLILSYLSLKRSQKGAPSALSFCLLSHQTGGREVETFRQTNDDLLLFEKDRVVACSPLFGFRKCSTDQLATATRREAMVASAYPGSCALRLPVGPALETAWWSSRASAKSQKSVQTSMQAAIFACFRRFLQVILGLLNLRSPNFRES